MFFTIEKFQKRVEELGERRYFAWQCLAPFTAMPGGLSPDEVYHELPDQIAGEPFALKDTFCGRDRYLWLEKTIRFPRAREGCKLAGLFDFGEAGGGKSMEGLLYVDGECYQGIDANHKEVIFPGMEGKEVRLTFLLWTGLEGGGPHQVFYHQMHQADLAYLHEKTDELYFYTKAITETLLVLDQEDENYENLTAILERALLCVDWDEAGFFSSTERAWEALMEGLNNVQKNTDVTVHTIGHTHIDLAWLWRLKHTREKAQRSFSTVLHLMEQYDDYRFLQSQPQLYKFVKEDNPRLYRRIQEKIREGRWEPDGGMWVEADCNIPSGESLVRQFLHGTRFMEQEFGKKCEFLWLPDVFGYSWALPQILKQCEISTFMTIKIGWSQYNTFPCDLFKWRGMDGTEVLTYFISTPDEGQPENRRGSTYNGVITPFTVKGCWKRFKNKELTKDVLFAFGHGDGGGSANREMLELQRAIDRLPGMPHVKCQAAGEFFKRIHDQVEHTDRYVHTWDGELYLEYHRGTYTSQADTKKYNRRLEQKLRQCEWLASLNYLRDGSYPKQELYDSWECLLLHQFHDIIPGSSIHEVYEDAAKSYCAIEERQELVEQAALKGLTEEAENWYGIYLANSFGGMELAVVPESRRGSFYDEKGRLLKSQRSGDGYEVRVDVKPFSTVNLEFCPGQETLMESPFTFEADGVETPFYSIKWDAQGHIICLYDKEAKRPVLKAGGRGNVLEVYEDKPMNYDAWDIDLFYIQKKETMELSGPVQLVQENGLKAVMRFTYRYRSSTLCQDLIVYRDLRRIDFKTQVDWQETHRLLKASFDTDIRSTTATYDSQFGHLERPTHWNQSWDWAKFEVCGHKWADISEEGYGVSLINDCKYGYSIKDSTMKLSLLKSAISPDTQADKGEHEFIYSLYPHQGALTEGGTIEAANQLNTPVRAVKGKFTDTRQLIRLEGRGVQVDAVKKAEDEECLLVRMHECLGGRRRIVLCSDYPLQEMIPCNMLEHDCGKALSGNRAELEFGPFEIKNYKIFINNVRKY